MVLALPEIEQSFQVAAASPAHLVRVALRHHTALETRCGEIPRPSDARRFAACNATASDA